jgi:hypothetical protein
MMTYSGVDGQTKVAARMIAMTLISSHIHPAFAVQISDRLVVEKRGTVIKPFDPFSNKSVVFWARDAIVSIGYTGLAFVGDMPMDEWIAATLMGRFPTKDSVTMGKEVLAKWFDIGQAVDKLLVGLRNSEVGKATEPFEMVIVGWKWRQRGKQLRRVVPIMWVLRRPFTHVSRQPRWWFLKSTGHSYVTPGSNADRQKFLAIREQDDSKYKFDPQTVVNHAEQSFVRATRESANPKFVGQDYMSIVIAPPSILPRVRITFFPKEVHRFNRSPAAHTPWVVGRDLILRPVLVAGMPMHFKMGPFDVSVGGIGGITIPKIDPPPTYIGLKNADRLRKPRPPK